jgi:Ala-tRNA(Pro) deacylase
MIGTKSTEEVPMAAPALTAVLDSAGVQYEVIPHAHSETAADEARALGLPLDGVAKTLVVETAQGNVRAVLPASERISTTKVAELLGERRKSIHLVPEETLRSEYPEFEFGAVPPIGGAHRDRVIVDTNVAGHDSIVLEAGSHDDSIRIATDDLVRIADARIADICVEE